MGTGLLWASGGYTVAALVGYLLINSLSSNTHDRALEAAMTSAFVVGPLGGIIAFVVGFLRSGKPPSH